MPALAHLQLWHNDQGRIEGHLVLSEGHQASQGILAADLVHQHLALVILYAERFPAVLSAQGCQNRGAGLAHSRGCANVVLPPSPQNQVGYGRGPRAPSFEQSRRGGCAKSQRQGKFGFHVESRSMAPALWVIVAPGRT